MNDMTKKQRIEYRIKAAMEYNSEGKAKRAFEELLDAVLEMNGYDSNQCKVTGFSDKCAILKEHEPTPSEEK